MMKHVPVSGTCDSAWDIHYITPLNLMRCRNSQFTPTANFVWPKQFSATKEFWFQCFKSFVLC